jgi:hypothetical protein
MKITSITIDGNEVKNFVRGKYQLTVQSRDDFMYCKIITRQYH